MLKNLFTSKESRGKRALRNPIDDACNMSKDDIDEVIDLYNKDSKLPLPQRRVPMPECNLPKENIREVLYKQLRLTCDCITLGDIKYRKIDADCWQCESTGVNYSDNVMHQIVEFFEEHSKGEIANYSIYKIN